LVNITRKAIDSGAGAQDAAVREAAEAIASVLSIFAPYVAEEMWELLGNQFTVAWSKWPEADPALLIEDSVTAIIQVDGKFRDTVDVSVDIAESDLEALARSSEAVQRALLDREVVKVILRAPKLV